VEKGSVTTAMAHGLVGPKALAKVTSGRGGLKKNGALTGRKELRVNIPGHMDFSDGITSQGRGIKAVLWWGL